MNTSIYIPKTAAERKVADLQENASSKSRKPRQQPRVNSFLKKETAITVMLFIIRKLSILY